MKHLEYLISLVALFVFGLFWEVVAFAINFLQAKYILFPLIGTNICYALNLVLNTNIFTEATFPVIFATASFVGSVLFKNTVSYKPSTKHSK